MNNVQSWAREEFAGVNLGDERLNKRLARIAEAVSSNPNASIPRTFVNMSATKACYNFLASEKVTPVKVLMPHQQRTVERLRQHPVVLVAQDITDLDFTGRRSLSGLGYLDTPYLLGLKVQTALAITPEGAPLGILEQHTWIRPLEELATRTRSQKSQRNSARPIGQKQTQRWLDVQESVYRQCADSGSTVVVVADREADFYEFFALPRPERMHALIRVRHDRKLESEQIGLRAALAAQPVFGHYRCEVPRGGERPPRRATLTVRALSTTLSRPAKPNSAEAPECVDVRLIEATESNPPSGQKPISWTLLTTLPITTIEDAARIIVYYTRRWLVERFHYTLKSGCAIEQLQLESRERIEVALAIYSVVAWRLMDLLYQSRVSPQADAAEHFDADELVVLRAVATTQQPTKSRTTNRRIAQRPVESLTLRQAVIVIARKGGFLARAGDGEPGIKTLWHGLTKLAEMVDALRLLRQADPLMGNA